ncbi:hypothetical protein A3F37_01175 [Candidatus Saccharibacteria bacterium RIFCSPHIGHO2_12_FULL_41_12]|nr:MAG: hypothetical protein A3F37_01175 [Candidatus Saccharibacteria bacterium RIFCSPHIGHO2_12_FULL_41_12]
MSLKTRLNGNLKIIFLIIAILLIFFSLRADVTTARLGKQDFRLEKANTQQKEEAGLSGRQSLGKYHGMIFQNNGDSDMCMWMKDMRFDLAMIWVDGSDKVTYIEPHLTSASYPKTFCHPGDQVIEVNPTDQEASGLKVGDQLLL